MVNKYLLAFYHIPITVIETRDLAVIKSIHYYHEAFIQHIKRNSKRKTYVIV